MTLQRIFVEKYGADALRVLDALTPLTGEGVPAANADYVGQTYIDVTTEDVYLSVDIDSVAPADDWIRVDKTADDSAILALIPLDGIVSPAAHADFVGQVYVDTVAAMVYVAVATDSVAPADDWIALDKTDEAGLAPLSTALAPAAHASFIGQLHVDTALSKAYISVATNSADPTDDWKEITLAV